MISTIDDFIREFRIIKKEGWIKPDERSIEYEICVYQCPKSIRPHFYLADDFLSWKHAQSFPWRDIDFNAIVYVRPPPSGGRIHTLGDPFGSNTSSNRELTQASLKWSR